MYEKIITTLSIDFVLKLFGTLDTNIDNIEHAFSVTISNREGAIKINGENAGNVTMACDAIQQLERISALSDNIDENSVNYVISMIKDEKQNELSAIYNDCICLTNKGKPIKAKTVGQQKYVDDIKKNTIVFGIGPAGTGKTFLAVAMAVTALKQKQIARIILTRPAVEAGENLGFLPGDLQSKIDPYLRPLYDALGEMLGPESFSKHIEKGVIEIAPLAYMRGRTLDDAFIILDEAQNTTPEQMKMFLTRLGNNSKAIVTGDITQIDLPFLKKSGLVEVIGILDNIAGISIFRFTHKDVVRHPLVQKIILAYEKKDSSGQPAQRHFYKKRINN
ncbi:MAG TPA: phosphate starvation-inducible protein PhoH [Clostridiales bacterium]|nr:PhoH family protein [Eubacteriales bacterium]HBR30728.1 phosphate starvation-inducible protein PhoH [Clostridiales bacterium]